MNGSRAWGMVVGGLVLGNFLGCSPVSVSDRPIPGSSLVVSGDWDDLETSVDVGIGWAEVGLLGQDELMGGLVRYRVLTTRDEIGELIARPASDGCIALVAKIGPGDPEHEARLIRAVARRLGQLHGVDVAPIH